MADDTPITVKEEATSKSVTAALQYDRSIGLTMIEDRDDELDNGTKWCALLQRAGCYGVMEVCKHIPSASMGTMTGTLSISAMKKTTASIIGLLEKNLGKEDEDLKSIAAQKATAEAQLARIVQLMRSCYTAVEEKTTHMKLLEKMGTIPDARSVVRKHEFTLEGSEDRKDKKPQLLADDKAYAFSSGSSLANACTNYRAQTGEMLDPNDRPASNVYNAHVGSLECLPPTMDCTFMVSKMAQVKDHADAVAQYETSVREAAMAHFGPMGVGPLVQLTNESVEDEIMLRDTTTGDKIRVG